MSAGSCPNATSRRCSAAKPGGDCSTVIVRPADPLDPRQATVAVVAAMSTPTKRR